MAIISSMIVPADTAVNADNGKELASYAVVLAGGAAIAQVLTPPAAMQAVSIENLSSNWLRVTVARTAATISAGAAPTFAVILSPRSVRTVDFGTPVSDASIVGFSETIASVSIVAVTAPVATIEASLMVANPATVAGHAVVTFVAA